MKAQNPEHEQERLAALQSLQILDTPPEQVFDRITRLVAKTLGVPVALFSLVDADRQWFKSRIGVDATETPREFAFCAHAILEDKPLIIPDARQDPRFKNNELVTGTPHIRFYAGVPISSREGLLIGTLCAIDDHPRTISQEQIDILRDLAEIVSEEIRTRETLSLAARRIAHSHEMVTENEERYRSMFELAAVGIALTLPSGRWISVNNALCNIVGYTADELTQLSFQNITYPDDLPADLNQREKLINGEIGSYQIEKRYIKKNGAPVWVHLSVARKTNKAGTIDYLISIVKDIQHRKEAELALAELHRNQEEIIAERTKQLRVANELLKESITQQDRYAHELKRRETELSSVLEHAQDAYIAIDDKGTITAWNQQASLTLGWSAAEAIGQSLSSMIIPRGQRSAHRAGMKKFISTGEGPVIGERIELTALRKDGSEITMEVRVRAHQVDEQVFFSAFLHDISARKGKEAELDRETRLDALTGLPNRRAIDEILARAQSRSDQSNLPYAVLFIDLDGFKSVNDSFGHDAGDQLLRTVADRLKQTTRRSDCAARLAGDEFTVILESLNSGLKDAHAAAEKILRAIAPPIELAQGQTSVGASIGIAVYEPQSSIPPQELIKIADNAMYEAKNAGKGTIRPCL